VSLVLCFPFRSFSTDRYYPCLSMDDSMCSRLSAVYIPLLCSIDIKATETNKSPFQWHLVRNRSIYDHCRSISPSHSFKYDLFCNLMSYEIPFTFICDSGSFRFLFLLQKATCCYEVPFLTLLLFHGVTLKLVSTLVINVYKARGIFFSSDQYKTRSSSNAVLYIISLDESDFVNSSCCF